MDYINISLVGLLCLVVGFVSGSRYRQARNSGLSRSQSLKAIIQGGGGPNDVTK